MPVRSKQPAAHGRLRASPSFSLTFTLDGRPYVAKDTEPYIQYWLSERDRVLLSLFSSRRGATIGEALAGYLRLTRAPRNAAERKRLARAIDDMRSAGVLMGTRDDVSRYTAKIVDAYVTHRPFPRELSDWIIRNAPVTADSRVLDLAGGPGDLALALAAVSNHVALMDLSKGFVQAAARRAHKLGRKLIPLHDSCNRLMYRDEEYDVVTVSQALHWLDDVMICRALCRCLRPAGSFFVVTGAFEVEDAHPLSYILGRRSLLGHKSALPFADQAAALLKRLTLLFEALDAPDVQRVDLAQRHDSHGAGAQARIAAAGFSLFRQRRPLGMGFLRGFLTPEHIAQTGQAPDEFWREAQARCAAATPAQLAGTYDWALLHFQRGATPMTTTTAACSAAVEIGYHGPAES